jgi:hypothetical protein|nr:MAG TPA: hypothetical protein [Caudoviricetes sp.]
MKVNGFTMEFAIAPAGSDMSSLDWKLIGFGRNASAKKRKPRITKKINKRLLADYLAKRSNA